MGQPAYRNASSMDVREALHAGTNELTRPISKAPPRQISATGGVIATECIAGIMSPAGLWLTPEQSNAANADPIAPPAREITADSPSTMPRIAPGVNPSVFKMPT